MLGSAMLARLQTAISFSSVYCTISQHRLEDRMVPRLACALARLTASLYSR